jgi:hypothetical protein
VLVEAINASRDVTVNFSRMGHVGRSINQATVFFNASLEGMDKAARTLRDRPLVTLLRLSALAVSTLLYWYWQHEKDWYKEAEDWQKYGFWTIDVGGKPVVRVPRPFEWGWSFSAGIEAMANAIEQRSPGEMGRWLKQAWAALRPGDDISLVMPIVETAFNYDTFRGRQIVSDEIAENRLPADQYYDYNTVLMKAMGRMANISPAKLEFLVNRLTGGMYRNWFAPPERIARGGVGALEASDIPFAGGLLLRTDYPRSVGEFYTERARLAQELGSAESGGKTAADLRDRKLRADYYADLLKELRQAVPKNASRDQRFEIERYMTGVARLAMGRPELDRYPNPLADSDSPPRVRQAVAKFLADKAIQATRDIDEKGRSDEWIQEQRAQRARGAAILKESGAGRGAIEDAMESELERRGYRRKTISQYLGRLD